VIESALVGRLGIVAMLVIAVILGYLARGGGDRAAPRAGADARLARELEIRVVELERRMDQLEVETAIRVPEAGGPAAAEAPAAETATEKRAPATPEERVRQQEQKRQDYVQRFRDAPTSAGRIAVVRDAVAQLKKDAGPAAVRSFLEEILRTVDPASEEGIETAFELCYDARAAADYARSDDLIRGIERLVPGDSTHYANTQFQLAWNRRFAGEPKAAEELFRRAAGTRGVHPTTKVAAYYAIASIRNEAGDAAGGREHLDLIVEEGKRVPAEMGVAYYVGLAKKLIDASPQ
jgi:hypothetical protein